MTARKPGPFLPNPTNDEPGVWTQNALASRIPGMVKGYTSDRVAPGNVFDHVFPTDMTAAGILAAVASLSGGRGTIHLRPGTWVIDSSISTPSRVRVLVEHGAVFTKSGTGSLSIAGPFEAPIAQVFSGFSPYDIRFTGPRDRVVPEWWGAVADGVSAADAAIQCAVTSVMVGVTDPAVGIRTSSCPVLLQAGTYRIDNPIKIYSVQGFHLIGAGKEQTKLVVYAADQEACLDLYGTAFSVFEGFTVNTSGDGSMTYGVAVRWTQGGGPAYRSSTCNTFKHILVTGKFVDGFSAPTVAQTDNTLWIDCHAIGTDRDDATFWQSGFRFNTGTTSNNLIHTITGFGVTQCKYGIIAYSTNMCITGGSFETNDSDLAIFGPPGYYKATGFRSEGSRRLFYGGGSGTYNVTATLEDILWDTTDVPVDESMILWPYPGHLAIRNLSLIGHHRVKLSVWGNADPRQVVLSLDGVMLNNETSMAYFLSTANATVSRRIHAVSEVDSEWAQSSIYNLGADVGNRYPLARTSGGIAQQVGDLGGSPGTVYLLPGAWTVNTELTIPASVHLILARGAVLTKDTGGSIVIAGQITAPRAQIFSGFSAGDITISGVEILPEWWGAVANDSTDCAAAIQDAIDAAPAGGTVLFGDGTYRASSAISLTRAVCLRGTGVPYTSQAVAFGTSTWNDPGNIHGSVIRCAATSGNCFHGTLGLRIENLSFVGPGTGTSVGMYLEDGQVASQNTLICNFATGLVLDNVSNSCILSPRFRGCTVGLSSENSSNFNEVVGIETLACGTGVSCASTLGLALRGGIIKSCLTYGVDTSAGGSVNECLFDGIYFENTESTAAINLTGNRNRVMNCRQGYIGFDKFLVTGIGHDIVLAGQARAVVLDANSTLCCVSFDGTSPPAGSSDGGTSNTFIARGSGGFEFRSTPAATQLGVPGIIFSGSQIAHFAHSTAGGQSFSIQTRDDMGLTRVCDATRNQNLMKMTGSDDGPKICFYDGTPAIKPTVTGTNFTSIASIMAALSTLGLATVPTKAPAGAAPPASGTWEVGDVMLNTSPSAGGWIGWVCVSAGTPGTWKGFGAIESP